MLKITFFAACLVISALAEYHGHDYYDYDAYPKYKFEYGVDDSHTGDKKSQWEQRDGEIVVGSYSLDEADGSHRVVTYNSDDHNGFHAHVLRVGHGQHPHGESYSNIEQHF
ncbi:cuticle protein 19-like [Toxorhynchites rutilus septentrionalis]|uniref:cuticle protein 19-like n=1 Tax=Toxorhynchites rutilus septentrionalis TaxID=329112 RepID=UPI00247AFEB1|nr:cuticle protein 19-like [Toxorhynchites rutilus septentrionalis]